MTESLPNYAELVQRPDEWQRVLANDPDLMHGMIQGVLKLVQSEGDAERVGRRAAAAPMTYDELWATMFPARFSVDPLPAALRALMGEQSMGQFAIKVPCTHATISFLLSGKRTASPDMMAALARAGRVTPAYFHEYRVWLISGAIAEVLARDPRYTATLVKRLALAVPR